MITLSSGEALSQEEILEGLLLLAANQAPFPILSAADAHIAVLMLIPAILAYNEEHEIL